MATVLREMPLFPLPEVVLFPGCLLPLHIFEPRYREMVNNVLESDSRFGVLNLDPFTREPALIGCVAEILETQKLADGRMDILTCGRERFRILGLRRDKAYLIGTVEFIEDTDEGHELNVLACQMKQLLKDVVRLSAKLADKHVDFPEDLPNGPKELSFWVAGSFPGLPDEQQALLEMEETGMRLKRETEILTSACKQLAARTALKDAVG